MENEKCTESNGLWNSDEEGSCLGQNTTDNFILMIMERRDYLMWITLCYEDTSLRFDNSL